MHRCISEEHSTSTSRPKVRVAAALRVHLHGTAALLHVIIPPEDRPVAHGAAVRGSLAVPLVAVAFVHLPLLRALADFKVSAQDGAIADCAFIRRALSVLLVAVAFSMHQPRRFPIARLGCIVLVCCVVPGQDRLGADDASRRNPASVLVVAVEEVTALDAVAASVLHPSWMRTSSAR